MKIARRFIVLGAMLGAMLTFGLVGSAQADEICFGSAWDHIRSHNFDYTKGLRLGCF